MRFALITVLLFTGAVVGLFASLTGWSSEVTKKKSTHPVQLLPGELIWKSDPNLHGLQTAILTGNPNLPAPYAERIKLPPGCRLAPHSHPNPARMVTMLSGTLYFAFGENFDELRLKAFPPGSFFTEPENMPHFSMTKEEVVLQLNAIVPASTNYIVTDIVKE